jgi:hypothetical protein
MSSTQDVVLSAAALNTLERKDKRKKKKRMSKKRLYIFLDDSKLAFNGREDVPKLWSFDNCEAYIEWCHISRDFLHDRYRKHCKADKANLHYC